MRNKLKDRISYGRVYRIWHAEGLSLPRKRKSKRLQGKKHRWLSAIAPNSIWAYDFVFDACANGQKLKCLTLIDEWTRECLAILPAARIRSAEVIDTLSQLFAIHGSPAFIRSDNGPEFSAAKVQQWLSKKQIKTIYIDPGSPWKNGSIESFHSRFRDECLGREMFLNLRQARVVISAWQLHYNKERPHGRLGYRSPDEFIKTKTLTS